MVSAAFMKDLLKGGGKFGDDLLFQALVESGARRIGGSGTWGCALLHQGQQIEQGLSGEFGA